MTVCARGRAQAPRGRCGRTDTSNSIGGIRRRPRFPTALRAHVTGQKKRKEPGATGLFLLAFVSAGRRTPSLPSSLRRPRIPVLSTASGWSSRARSEWIRRGRTGAYGHYTTRLRAAASRPPVGQSYSSRAAARRLCPRLSASFTSLDAGVHRGAAGNYAHMQERTKPGQNGQSMDKNNVVKQSSFSLAFPNGVFSLVRSCPLGPRFVRVLHERRCRRSPRGLLASTLM